MSNWSIRQLQKISINLGRITFFTFLLIILMQNCTCKLMESNVPVMNGFAPKVLLKSVFIPDDFTSEQIEDIKSAFHSWEEQTHHSVQFSINEHYDKWTPRLLPGRSYNLVLVNCAADAPMIVLLDKKVSKEKGREMIHFGYYDPNDSVPTIYLVSSRISTREMYQTVVKHEIGHVLGLDHNPKVNTLMYENTDLSSKEITSSDVESFCFLHRCDWLE